MTHLIPMADAAFAANIPPGYDIAGGYYGGPFAYHIWPPADWARFPGYKLPIWVGGQEGSAEATLAAAALDGLGVPEGAITTSRPRLVSSPHSRSSSILSASRRRS